MNDHLRFNYMAIGFVLLKWASLWRWKVAGVLIPVSWFAVAMGGTMESNPALWIQAITLSVAFLSPVIVQRCSHSGLTTGSFVA